MITLEENKDLTGLSTLGCTANARWYYELKTSSDLPLLVERIQQISSSIKVLGSGSNLVLTPNIDAVVVHNSLIGIEVVKQDDSYIWLEVQGGEIWHSFVNWCVVQGYSGVENLALIPGTVGAAPVQNIGAYGVEVASVVEQVTAFDIQLNEFVTLTAEDCKFSYRDSLFKEHEGRFVISSVRFKLSKQLQPILTYGPLQALADHPNLNVQLIFDSVIAVRTEKLPDPASIPNAGSFFKNPIISVDAFSSLVKQFPDIVHYPAGSNIKLAAGWLIDQVGLKGQSNLDGVGCYAKQALVLVNPNKANGEAVLAWAGWVQQQVYKKFGVTLEMEPRIWR
ncbi:UDP-N-acetylmuramate dehydrogenase [Reinekea forsetii]|nr:UDP-N-acetylmuramate dehydrogenase [Reinekea forsetii]